MRTPDFAYALPLPRGRDLGIGIIGAGNIVRNSHLPAYASARFAVRGIVDRDADRAASVARQFGLPLPHGSVGALLSDPAIDVVDIAVPPANQPAIAMAAIEAGKHLLCQKPLATSLDDAHELVIAAEEKGVVLCVNQNARWVPGIRATANLLRGGELGDPLGAHFDLGWSNDYASMDADWKLTHDLTLRTDVVHHVDTSRLWFGEPDWVFATSWPRALGETGVEAILHFEAGFAVSIRAVGGEAVQPAWARYRVEGTKGRAEGELAQYLHYGSSVADPFEVRLADHPDAVFAPRFPYTTVPDAFTATMGTLLRAVEDGAEPSESGGRDNLRTLAVLEALAESIDTAAVVAAEDFRYGGNTR